MKFSGMNLRGMGNDVINLLDILGAYCLIKPGERTTYEQGVTFSSIESVIDTPYIKLEKSNLQRFNQIVYRSGRPYMWFPSQTSQVLNPVPANWNFLHKGNESYSIFLAFNSDNMPQGTGTDSTRYIVGSKLAMSGSTAGLCMRLYNNTTKPYMIQVSRNSTVELETAANAFLVGQVNLMEFRFTKTGTQNKLELFVNRVLQGTVTNTTADKTDDVAGFYSSAYSLSEGRFLGYYGELFIVKNTGKTEAQVLEESTIINTYFNKYPIPVL